MILSGGGISELRLNGEPLKAGKRYTIALNSYDAQSGGRSMMVLRQIVQAAESKRTMTGVGTREAFIDWLLEKGSV